MENKYCMDGKALFVASMPFLNQKNTGGIAIMNRNYGLICDAFGTKNVDICVVNPDNNFLREIDATVGMTWIEGNIRGIKRTLNEFMGHNYITNAGERVIKKKIVDGHYNLIWLDSPQYGRLAEFIKKNTSSKVVTFAHNVESEYIKIYCKPSWKKPHFKVKIMGIEMNEKKAISFSDKFICISPRDCMSYEKKFSCKIDTIFSVTLDDKAREADLISTNANDFLFVGSYFKPNIDGAKWLAENVAPYVDARIDIVGKGMDKLTLDMNDNCLNNIYIVGGVEDLGQYYKEAAAIVMPIFSGSGMKVKTAEAMMYGKPIIATDEALEGYDVEDLKGVYRCNTANEFVQAIKDVKKTGRNYYPDIRAYYMKYCDSKKLQSRAKDIIESMVNR